MTQRRPATDDEAKALASSLRLRILRICLGEPHTNKEIAEILGRDPASVLHHTRTLVRTGFLEAQEERRGARGAREIPYLATRKSWRLEVPALDRTMLETFLEELALVPAADVDSTRMGLRLSPGDMDEFRSRLSGLLEEFAERPSDLAEPAWSFFMVLHPDPNHPHPNRPEPEEPGEPDVPTGSRGPSNGPASTR
ncbi:ArsR/SmtB family transcription factor [Streptacidiphilus fuscans]|uniref:Helix-turn-helix domain-containing protein n=1 Tax=Streptacidiphilus fuscans TaxID=2789292 RepID=A0A931B2J2_9ACTN|nr:winged helix-turn-helix domain-containing protein [Streptacidiphilus fuscans]MBF9069914.1 helix-turn-helix domain-containing protein [Streptacidiphilus fuscans]